MQAAVTLRATKQGGECVVFCMVCRIQDYLRERQAREDEEAAKKAGKKEVADRIYERLKGQAQAEAAAREEEERLINLLRAEEEAERARRSAATIHWPA